MGNRITIQGKVNPGIIRRGPLYRNHEWLFIDYAENDIPLKREVPIAAIQGEDNMLLSTSIGVYTFKILECRDQFDRNFQEVPRGWKTMCKIEFQPEIPIWVQRLKYREGWGFHKEQIILFYE